MAPQWYRIDARIRNCVRVGMLLITILLLGLGFLISEYRNRKSVAANVAGPGEYLFCTWNVENLFDDRDDKRNRIDEEYDSWFVQQPADRELKLERLCDVLLKMNGGKGPDILCVTEVESKRAAVLLLNALNKRLPEGTKGYETVLMEEVSAGRHIAPAIISRLPGSAEYPPRQPDKLRRIVVGGLVADGHELTIYAAHWTSQRTDDDGGQRDKYADGLYGDANRIYHRDPKADIIVCGDFNDEPDAPSIRDNLRATGDISTVRASGELRFLNLLSGKDAKQFGTHYYNKPLIYDQICVAPGLLDDVGWSCDVESIRTITDGMIKPGSSIRKPWRFGNRNDTTQRGYSDHFPVVVKLRVGNSEKPK